MTFDNKFHKSWWKCVWSAANSVDREAFTKTFGHETWLSVNKWGPQIIAYAWGRDVEYRFFTDGSWTPWAVAEDTLKFSLFSEYRIK